MIQKTEAPFVNRHKAAIVRKGLSRPVRLVLEAGILSQETTFFDYGCGHGLDVQILSAKGHISSGWDPYYYPDSLPKPADVVNISYVINVIENEQERRMALTNAWGITNKVLVVAAQVMVGEPTKGYVAYNDGLISSRNTFQKYYEQHELKAYIDSVLGTDAVPVGLGVYFIFRDESQAQAFRASRFHSRATTPKIKISLRSFDDYRDLLSPLMEFVSDRGRLPVRGELANESAILNEFRSLNKAFDVIKRATDKDEWERLIEKRRQDLLVYIALSRFDKRPQFTYLPVAIQHDIKALFGNYTNACREADKLLFDLGQPNVLAKACKNSEIGKFVGNALYVHVSALDHLSPSLRLYESCASRAFGKIDKVTIVKLRADKPAISYLYYPEFDTDPHPALQLSMRADLKSLYVRYSDYSKVDNPPILHRKETFVTYDYPLYEEFARLTTQEENWGLLDDPTTIGTRKGWTERLQRNKVKLQGHQLFRLSDTIS